MTQRRAVGLLSLVLGGGFLLRAISGYCPVKDLISRRRKAPEGMVPAEALGAYPRLDVSRQGTLHMRNEPSTKSKDTVVEEASMESFPASDPPSWVV